MRSFFWDVFSSIWTEYKDLCRKSPCSVRIQENMKKEKLRYLSAKYYQENKERLLKKFRERY